MFNRQDFLACVAETLTQRGYGSKGASKVMEYYKRRATAHEEAGKAPEDAAMSAMTDVFNELDYQTAQKAKKLRKDIAVTADSADRIQQATTVRTNFFKAMSGDKFGKDSRGVALGHAAVSMLEDDKRFKGINAASTYRVKLKSYWAMMHDVLEDFSKGAFGRQIGTAHFDNIVRELHGESTGDRAAKQIAKSYKRTQEFMVDDFNNAGGSLRKLVDFALPQRDNYVKIGAAGRAAWIKDHMAWTDWSSTRWPDGSIIQPAEREAMLGHVYDTKVTDGRTDIDTSVGHGQGRAVGNMLENHRFLIYKDASSWLANHAKYSDGSVFDVIAGHIDSMAHKTALVTHFGQNPKLMAETIKKQVRKAAGDLERTGSKVDHANRAGPDAEAVLRKYDMMMEMTLHENALNPHSRGAAIVSGTSNLLTAALLGRASILAVLGDSATSMAVKMSNHEPIIAGLGTYLNGMTKDYKLAEKVAAQTGYIFDEQVMSQHIMQRFTGVATYGPEWTRRVGDWSMRSTLMNRHTTIARWAHTQERMGHLWRQIETPFDKLENRAVFEHYGITSDEWDRVRKKIDPYTPQTGVEMFNPQNILNIKDADKEKLFLKFATMIDQETQDMVPGATREAAVTLRATTRPDTTVGALLHSFGMFKNYPITIFNMYGRRALAAPNTQSRAAFVAALGVGMIVTGALGVQMRELSQGRTPIDMRKPQFWGKAIMASGGLSIWGDFLFGGNSSGSSFSDTAAGPLAGLANDMVDVSIGSGFNWIHAMEQGDPYGGKWASKLTEFAKRYNPLASSWWAGLVLQREVFDQLQRLIDPVGARKREQATQQRQLKAYGNQYYLPPGQRIF